MDKATIDAMNDMIGCLTRVRNYLSMKDRTDMERFQLRDRVTSAIEDGLLALRPPTDETKLNFVDADALEFLIRKLDGGHG